jgi:cyclopropane-fatty-acyl-phospholipid synthase
MTYSSGWFQGDLSKDLASAQDAKYDRILDQIQAQPGQTILEVGCGWGGFAERAALRGLNVVGITLSDAQLEWATQRMQDTGLSDRVCLRLQDYRDVPEQFDHIVSIEMFEAVGLLHWPSYFQMLARCLKPGGKVVVQSRKIVLTPTVVVRILFSNSFSQEACCQVPQGLKRNVSRQVCDRLRCFLLGKTTQKL